ncbi:MAG: DUF4347 domain-containing protein, partial [Lentisphaeria bacterium]|nr:DUF4347 domain-containing protein [Lentisphaeria bacterium]
MSKKNKVEIFKLEERVLFEAGAVIQAAEAAAAEQANNDAMTADAGSIEGESAELAQLAEMPVPPEMSGSDDVIDAVTAFSAVTPSVDPIAFADAPFLQPAADKVLVILNSSVADADTLIKDLGDNVEVLKLTAGTDAMDAINDYLDEHADTKYSAIHLVSHGSEGYITLNGEKIDSTTINPADWKAIGDHLTDDADILVYGCDTAKSDEGKALVQSIANLTGADVAASTDATGATGDWDLEYRSGLIEAATIKPVSYQYDLPASTITVNSLVDSADDGSAETTTLREAITEANTNGGEYIIVFDQNLAKNADLDGNTENGYEGYQIKLTSSLSICKSGLNLKIDGMIGKDRVILDGGDEYDGTTVTEHSGYQIMTVANNVTVTLSNLTLQNGYYLGKEGGAAILNKGTVTLNNVDVLSNFAQANGNHVYGAGIYNAGTMNVNDSYFEGKSGAKASSANYYIHGAGLYNNTGATLNVSGTTFKNNIAYWGGGAILNKGTLNVEDSIFNGNHAKYNGIGTGSGGAICSSAGTVTVSGSTFESNGGSYGGGISVESGSKVFITDSFFNGNTGGRGSGVYATQGGSAVVMNSTFVNHTAAAAIGAFIQAANTTTSVLVINSTLHGNKTAISTEYYSGSLNVQVVNSILTNSIYANNANCSIKVFNSIYNGKSNIASIDVESSGDNVVLTGNEVFGSSTVQANGTIVPVHSAALGKLATLSINADGDLVYGSTVVQTGTTLTAEQLANQSRDQLGNSRGTKTIGAVSAKENLTSLVVNTTNGADAYDNLTSIEEAVAYANTLTGEQTITFAQDLAKNYDADGNGENDTYLVNLSKSMSVNKSGLTLTIDGAIGENKVTLDAGGKFRHFSFSNAVITLQNMTLQNAYAKDTNGGSITSTSTLTIDNVSFLNNELERIAGAYGKG